MSTAALVRLRVPKPHAAQQTILPEMRRFNVVNCGRRWGKTVLGQNRLIPIAVDMGMPCAWFAPTYKYLYEVWDFFRDTLRPITARANKTEQRIELITGGVIEFWSLKDNPDAGRSRRYKRVIVDEAAKVPNLEKVWHEAIRPTLSDYVGDADMYSTPKGMNFFAHAYALGQDPLEREWRSWTRPTRTNPYIRPSEIEDAKHGLPERVYQQEYLAEFIEDAGGVFRGVSACVDKSRTNADAPSEDERYRLGVDLARVEDFTVLTVLDPRGRQVYHERFNQISWERQCEAISRVSTRYNDARVYLDSTGVGDPIYERLRKAGVHVTPYVFTNTSKEALIDNLAMLIESGGVRLMDIPTQTTELQAYQYELTASRNVRMNAPEGLHDDCVISLALAAWGMATKRKFSVTY